MINRNCHFCRHLRCSYVRKTCLKYVCYALGIFPELFRFDIFFCAEFFNNICFWSSTYFLHFYSRKVSREIFKTFNLWYIGNSKIRMAAWKFKLKLLCKVFSIPIVAYYTRKTLQKNTNLLSFCAKFGPRLLHRHTVGSVTHNHYGFSFLEKKHMTSIKKLQHCISRSFR